jgi:hypothetical protein
MLSVILSFIGSSLKIFIHQHRQSTITSFIGNSLQIDIGNSISDLVNTASESKSNGNLSIGHHHSSATILIGSSAPFCQ